MIRLLARTTLALSWLVSSLAAQRQVWVVDDTASTSPDFTSMQTAIDTVAEGDVLLVKGGTYGFAINGKSLTIQAERGARVTALNGSILALGPLQTVQLRGLTIRGRDAPGLDLRNCQGTIWVEECSISSYFTGDCYLGPVMSPGTRVENCLDVILIRTTSEGTSAICTGPFKNGGNGLSAGASSIHAYGCTFQGGSGTDDRDGYGGAGLAAGDFVFLSDCHLTGGPGYCIAFGPCGGGPGVGLNAYGGTTWVLDSVVQPGVGHPELFCSSSCTAPAETGTVHHLAGEALAFHANSPVREGQTMTFSFQGPPGVSVWLASSLQPHGQFLPAVHGSALVTRPPTIRFIGVLDASGTLQMSRPMPFLGTSVEGVPGFAQAYYLSSSGGYFLGEGSMVVGLDQSF